MKDDATERILNHLCTHYVTSRAVSKNYKPQHEVKAISLSNVKNNKKKEKESSSSSNLESKQCNL
jgi:hypothetical protein